jgi:predicted DCC family thiol-disulfide oxidoreductase YuxK
LANFLKKNGAFVSDAQAELPKFALLRIAFGLFMLWRAIEMARFAFPSDWNSPTLIFFYACDAIVPILVTVGLFTQFALAFLIVVQWQVGTAILESATLGNDIGAILALLLLLVNAGAHLSVDGWIMRRGRALSWAISRFYFPGGSPSNSHIQLAKFVTLLCFWLICLSSAALHLSEPAWTTGVAGPWILTNNFSSRLYYEFMVAFSNFGSLVFVARACLYTMIVWYILIIPFVLMGGIFRKLIIIWGLLFFILSSVELQLGYLGWFELIFWAGLFWQAVFMSSRGSLAIAYDDRCNLCDRTVNFLLAVDVFRQIELKPVNRNVEFLAQHGISNEAALSDLYGVDLAHGGRQAAGYDLYLLLTRRLFLLLPAYPVLLLGKRLWIGPATYRWVAARRTRLFGVCELASPKKKFTLPDEALPDDRGIQKVDFTIAVLCHVMVLSLAFLFVLPLPVMRWYGVPMPRPMTEFAVSLRKQIHMYGVEVINVFNTPDLRVAESWFTVSARSSAGREKLLPIFSEDGGRLRWNDSDRIRYALSVPWRRTPVTGSVCDADSTKRLMAAYAGLSDALSGERADSFVFRQYYQPLAAVSFEGWGSFKPNPVQNLCEVSISRAELKD